MSYTPVVRPSSVVSYLPTKQFDPRLSIYNLQTDTLRKVRRALARAQGGTGFCKIACLGDSTTEGSFATIGSTDWPNVLRALLTARGYPLAGTGFVRAKAGNVDPRVTTTGAPSSIGMLLQLNGAVGTQTITFASALAGTVVDVYYLDQNAAATFSVNIDGTGATTVTGMGDNTFKKTSFTGLSNAAHSVVITRVGTVAPYIGGFDVHQVSGVSVSNFGLSGQIASAFSQGNDYDLTGATIVYGADLTFIMLQINDANASTPVATYTTAVQVIINRIVTAGNSNIVLVITDPVVSTTAPIGLYIDATYQLADSYGFAVLDISDRWKSYAISNGLGLMADGVHPNVLGYADIARAAMNCIEA